ncbi:MAG: hypothetical protein A2Y10_17520 [Planctomycetes bacterium GWF2_41_51]|nr:MAG: hypothetical protein A2Y10_17520 [Planctomycetes bacterium GWF2_41_51]HBG28026.1 hypothetical protein [Phycisphaerales bacterium]
MERQIVIKKIMNQKVLFVLFVAGLSFSANGKVLFYNSFDNGLDADFAEGSTKSVHHDSLSMVAGKSGNGLWCRPNQYIRFETDGNIDLKKCTMSLWIKTNYTLPAFRSDYSEAVQCIFSMKIRTDDLIELRLKNDSSKSALSLMTGAKGKGKSNIEWNLEKWGDKSWHHIVVSWQQPGMLAMKVDDGETKIINNAVLPSLPEKMFYDIYFGTNSMQSRHAKLEHFDGIIDDILISDQWLFVPDKSEIPEIGIVKVPEDFNCNPKQIGKNRLRVNLCVKPISDKWSNVPVKAVIDLGEKWLQLSPIQKRQTANSFRLVRYDSNSGEPVVYDVGKSGDEQYYMPFVVDDDVFYKRNATLRFVHKGSGKSGYSFYYGFEPLYDKPFPEQIPMVGNGDRLRIGIKTTIGTLCSGISGVFDVYDIDKDGDLDLWMNSGTLVTRTCTGLQAGHYYFENISNERGIKNLFAPGRLIIRDNTPFGYISGNTNPVFCDVNNDQEIDVLMLGRECQDWWQWHYENGNIIVDKINKLQFRGDPLVAEHKTYWYDWDGDGLGDVIASGLPGLSKDEDLFPVVRICRNIGTANEPLIDTQNPIEPNVGKPLLQRQYIPADWDCDGDIDFVSAGFIHELFFHENISEKGQPPKFANPVRLMTYDRREINITQALINIVVCDWDNEGDKDLLYGCEDGVVGFMENIAGPDTLPKLRQPVYFQQEHPIVDGGSLSIPVIVDWDDDGDNDLILAGSNTLQYYENVGDNDKPVWNWPHDMCAGDSLIQLRAGDDGSVQGIEELCWQYNNAEVADWDNDGLKDLIVSGIRGEHMYFRNIGYKGNPRLAAGELIKVAWPDKSVYPEWQSFRPQPDSLITVWRTRPATVDWDKDGLMDYVTLDHKGDLALYRRSKTPEGKLVLNPPDYIFEFDAPYSQALVWNRAPNATAGKSGRTVINIVDWDKDGDFDLILDNVNARYYENIRDNNKPLFVDRGDLVKERLTNHNDGPYVADFDNDGWCDLFIGTETGRVFYFSRPYIEGQPPVVIIADKNK